jgi:hypothetical protein
MTRKILVGLLSVVSAVFAQQPASSPADDHQLMLQLLQRVNELEAEVARLRGTQPGTQPAAGTAALPTPAASLPLTAVTTPPTTPVRTASAPPDSMPGMALPEIAGLQFRGFADTLFTDSNQKGAHSTFSEGAGFDFFMTGRMSDQFSAVAEMLIEYVPTTNATSLDLERLELHYTPSDYFNLTAGRFHTAIGYYNTAYHHANWLLPTVTRPTLFAFEDQGGILPTHNVGLSANGAIPSGPLGLHYIAEIGNGRSANALSAVQVAQDDNSRKSYNFAAFSRPAAIPGFQTGFSVYGDRYYPTGLPKIGETIWDGYVTYHPSGFEFTSEALVIRHALEGTNVVFHTPGFYSIVTKDVGRGVKPYFSWQYVNAALREPLFGASVGLNHGPATGVRYDFTDFVAFKLEYYRLMRRAVADVSGVRADIAVTF